MTPKFQLIASPDGRYGYSFIRDEHEQAKADELQHKEGYRVLRDYPLSDPPSPRAHGKGKRTR